MTIIVHGIKNCDTMKKTFQWLDKNGIDYIFHDYKKIGVDMDILKKAMDQYGWENVINRKGLTWKQIPQEQRETMTREQAELLADAKPSVNKRPLIVKGSKILLGYDPDTYNNQL